MLWPCEPSLELHTKHIEYEKYKDLISAVFENVAEKPEHVETKMPKPGTETKKLGAKKMISSKRRDSWKALRVKTGRDIYESESMMIINGWSCNINA